jgi:hypothetical protein
MRSHLVCMCVCVRVRAALHIINFKMQIVLICSLHFCIKLHHGDEQ